MTPEQQQALYEANVLKIAEEMARDVFVRTAVKRIYIQGWEGINENIRKELIADCIPAARIALKHMAEEYIQGAGCRAPDNICSDEFNYLVNYHLQSRGLVPAKANRK
ncbi:hypothetical protein DCC81_24630 [Chitinophaga parva]|uniref:Uncharacterized protein n=1 Tax=Chitinophaga parva TaxID=2169414 RepID=A0A2T7BBM5_9BACT|nr:hypothetical protein [Chitinophaga parva]PUZ21777.1 hypothetical protein DCC81_24630 [Chitinophaga parva]